MVNLNDRKYPGLQGWKTTQTYHNKSFPSHRWGWNQPDLTVYLSGLCCCCCLASVLCMTSPSDLGDRRLFMPAFQVGRLRCARCRGLLNAKSHFTLVLMSPSERRGARTGRWRLQMRTPRTTSRPDTRCWFDYGVACKRVFKCMERARWCIQSQSSETVMSVVFIYLFIYLFVQTEVSSNTEETVPIMGEMEGVLSLWT